MLGLLNPPLTNFVYLLLFPSLGVHLSTYYSFGSTMNIGTTSAIGSIGSASSIGSTGSIGATSPNPYSLVPHSDCH